jgi:hypothetical protein
MLLVKKPDGMLAVELYPMETLCGQLIAVDPALLPMNIASLDVKVAQALYPTITLEVAPTLLAKLFILKPIEIPGKLVFA